MEAKENQKDWPCSHHTCTGIVISVSYMNKSVSHSNPWLMLVFCVLSRRHLVHQTG